MRVHPVRIAIVLLLLTSAMHAQLPGCAPPPAGVWGWWPFDDTSGTQSVSLIQGSAARLRNNPLIVGGRVHSALQFDGIDDYVDVPGDRMDPGRGDFSLALWLKTSNAPGVTTLVDRRDLNSTVRGFSLWLHNGKPGFQLADGGGPPNCSNDPSSGCTNYGSNVSVANGDWHFVAVTVDRAVKDGGRMYVDGKLIQTFDPTIRRSSLAATSPLRVGAHTGARAKGFFRGIIDELQFYRRALTAAEIAAIFAAGSSGVCKNILPPAVASAGDDETSFIPGVVVIKLEKVPANALRAALKSGTKFSSLPFPPAIQELNRRFGAIAVEPVFRSVPPGAPGGLDRFYRLTIDKRLDAAGAAFTYARAEGVDSADPDWVMHVNQSAQTAAAAEWNLVQIGAASAWKTTTGKNVLVAVVDTGILLTHPDLKANLWKNPKETPGDGIDNDGNGLIDDVHGWDFLDNDNDPTDRHGHGTHVAGTIAAANDSNGVTGVAPEARVLALRGLDADGGSTTVLAQAIEYAAAKGAHVINNSWGGEERSEVVDSAIAYARSKGAVVVSAAGNYDSDACRWTPGNAEGGLTVAASTSTDGKSGLSNFGVKLDVAAPGEDIRSTWLGDDYNESTGTSMAAPHVSGLAALLRQARPLWTPEEIRQAIRTSAVDMGTPGFDSQTGFGRIDITKALALTSAPPVASIETPTNCHPVSGTVRVSGSATARNFRKYELSIAPGADPKSADFKVVKEGATAVSDGLLASFDSLQREDGIYTLRLVTRTADAKVHSEDRNVIKIDNMSKKGWPTDVSGGSMKSPMVADLDGDGRKEIILGGAVFDAKGNVRPGWDATAGFGRTNPAVADVDGDKRLEVIVAQWSDVNDWTDESIEPETLGPEIFAFNADKMNETPAYDWKYVVKNVASADGYHHGIPSSIAVADVDGDNALEVVFTVWFDVDNPKQETRVFTLDAKSGKLETSFAVAGRSISSVALVPRPSGAGRFLVISSDKKLYVVDATGAAAPGWPRPQPDGSGVVDPVVADVDGDGKLEILAGQSLWSLDGKRRPGLPAASLAGSTGSVGQLMPGPELEVVLGGDKGTPYSLYSSAGTKIAGVKDEGEDVALELSDENGMPGVPILADLDGDGSADLLGPSQRGVDVLEQARLYAWRPKSPGARLPGFPRLVPTSTGVIRSSAAVDDIDGDGLTDLLIAGDGQLHVWNLNTRFDPANNPWPMFQHDLAHTGVLSPAPAAIPPVAVADLWIEDTPRLSAAQADDGSEPPASMAGQPVWLSRAIWVRNGTAPGAKKDDRDHQNPLQGVLNRVHVSVRNRGTGKSANGSVELFAASSLVPSPADWKSIGTATVPPLEPGKSTQVTIPWTPAAAGPYALLARVAEPLTHPETASVETNVRRNNNLAWRNVHVVTKRKETISVEIVNTAATTAKVDLTFTMPKSFVQDGGRMQVRPGQLWDKRSGAANMGAPNAGSVAITGFPATIQGITMAPHQRQTIEVVIDAEKLHKKKGGGAKFGLGLGNAVTITIGGGSGTAKQYVLDLTQSIDGVPAGGASYIIVGGGG